MRVSFLLPTLGMAKASKLKGSGGVTTLHIDQTSMCKKAARLVLLLLGLMNLCNDSVTFPFEKHFKQAT